MGRFHGAIWVNKASSAGTEKKTFSSQKWKRGNMETGRKTAENSITFDMWIHAIRCWYNGKSFNTHLKGFLYIFRIFRYSFSFLGGKERGWPTMFSFSWTSSFPAILIGRRYDIVLRKNSWRKFKSLKCVNIASAFGWMSLSKKPQHDVILVWQL